MTRWILSFAIGIANVGTSAHTHHSISAVYDSSRQVTIEGVVTQFQFVNPHPLVMMDVTDGGGNAQQWRLEMDNRSELAEIGVTTETLKPGDRIVVTGSLARAQSHSLYILTLDRHADGFRYEQVGSRPRIRAPSR